MTTLFRSPDEVAEAEILHAARINSGSREFRIVGSPDGGYHSGVAGRIWTDETKAREALTAYRGRVSADAFLSDQYRRQHIAAVHLQARTVTDWGRLDG